MNKVYSERVRAGKRTYFFDIRSTRSGDYYLTITERKRRFDERGEGGFEKFKLFLYKEDLNKFSDALKKAVKHLKEELMPDYDFSKFDYAPEESNTMVMPQHTIEKVENEDDDE